MFLGILLSLIFAFTCRDVFETHGALSGTLIIVSGTTFTFVAGNMIWLAVRKPIHLIRGGKKG